MTTLTQQLDEVLEWRWVDDKGRAMTRWKQGNPPPVLDLHDEKGAMHVEVRIIVPASDVEGR